MENITIVLSSTLTVPAIKGGAIEQLLDNFLRANEKKPQFRCTVIAHHIKGVNQYAENFQYSKFIYLKLPTLFIRINSYLINRFKIKGLTNFWEEKLIKAICQTGNKKVLLEGGGELTIKLKKLRPDLDIYYHLHADLSPYKNENELHIMNKINKVICVSEYIRQQQINKGMYKKRVATVLNGIESDCFAMNLIRMPKEEICRMFNLPKNKKIILFKGRVVREKGVIELIQAFTQIKNKEVLLLLAGSKNFGEKRLMKSNYERLVDNLLKEDHRIIKLGYVEYHKIPLLHKITDIVVVPSIWEEPCGLTAIEAVVSGIPLIASKTGGTPEIVDGTKAILIERNNAFVENLRKSLEQLLEDDKLCEKIRDSEIQKITYLSSGRYFKELCGLLCKK